MAIVVVMVGAIASLAVVSLILRYKRRTVADLRSRAAAKLSAWAKALADRFDGAADRASRWRVVDAIVSFARALYGSDRDEDWVRRRRPQPGLAGLVLAGLLLLVVLGQMNHLLAGMRPQDELRSTAMTALSGLSTSPEDAQAHVAAWVRWECEDLGNVECLDSDTSSWDLTGNRLHTSPLAVAQWYLRVDSLFIVCYTLTLGWALMTQWWGAKPRDDSPRARLWQRSLSTAGVILVIAAVADVVENVALWQLVAEAGRDQPMARLARIAGGVKLLGVTAVGVGLVYVVLFRPRDDGSLASRIGHYVRGLSGIRVGLIAAVFTWLLLFGPMFADQMLDVIRRWDVMHAVAVVTLTGLLTAVVGQSTRRVYLRRMLQIPRGDPDPSPDAPLCSPDPERRAPHSFTGDADLRALVIGIVLVLGVLGVAFAVLGREELRGLMVPAGIVVLLGAAGLPLPDASPRPRDQGAAPVVSPFAPRLLAAAIPAIVGLGVLRAVLQDFLLDAGRSPLWMLTPIVGVAVAVVANRLVHAARDVMTDRRRAVRARKTLLVASTVFVLAVFAVATVRPAPRVTDTLSPVLMLAIAFTLVALSHTAFYFFADPRVRPCSDHPRTPDGELHVPQGPAALLPGPSALPDQADTTGAGWVATQIRRHGWQAVLWVPALTLAGAVLLVVIRTIPATRTIGGVGVALLFALSFAVVAEAASRFVEATPAPRVLRAIGIRRTPVFTMLAVWAIVMTSSAFASGFHDVEIMDRVETTAEDAETAPTVSSVWRRWIERNGLARTGDRDPADAAMPEQPDDAGDRARAVRPPRRAVPMVFVSAWGGGIRAGVWTAYVLDCAFETHGSGEPWRPTDRAQPVPEDSDDGTCRTERASAATSIVAMSGISGGSVGFAQYAAHLLHGDQPSHDWVQERMGDDYLAPTLGRMLFVDMPLSLIGGSVDIDDRADVLQYTWEQSWDGFADVERGVFDLWDHEPDVPLMVMNSISMNHACGLNVSPLNASTRNALDEDCRSLAPFDRSRQSGGDAAAGAPAEAGEAPRVFRESGSLVGTHDLEWLLCDDQDVPLMSAALMSARFPMVSPTGRVTACVDDDEQREGQEITRADVFTSDGGQLDPSATLTATQLWESFEPWVESFNREHDDVCIAPVLIHMENGYAADVATSSAARPNEWVDPLTWSLTDAKSGLVGNARQRMALEFSEAIDGTDGPMRLIDPERRTVVSRVAYIRTRAHPGSSAPLGWTLSRATLDDLANQLGNNDSEFDRVRSWLSGDLACEPTKTPVS